MRLFRHGSSVGEKEQARRSVQPLRDPPLIDAAKLQRHRALALIGAIACAFNFAALVLQERFTGGFWCSFGAVVCFGFLTLRQVLAPPKARGPLMGRRTPVVLARSPDRDPAPRRRSPTEEWMVEDPTVAEPVIPGDVLVTIPLPSRGEG